MAYTWKPELVERISPLVGQGLNGSQIAKAVGIGEREARWYAQQIRDGRTDPNGSTPQETLPTAEPVMVPLAKIPLFVNYPVKDSTQARERLNPQTVREYAEALQEGAKFPPIVLFVNDVGCYCVGDGFHRIEAAMQVRFKTIKAEVRRGGLRDAQLYAAQANLAHGLRRTTGDKQRAVLILLRDEEWRRWSDRRIAQHCGVSPTFVGSLRASLSTVDSDNGQRIYTTKHGNVATMDTTRIGSREATTAPTNETSADDTSADADPTSPPGNATTMGGNPREPSAYQQAKERRRAREHAAFMAKMQEALARLPTPFVEALDHIQSHIHARLQALAPDEQASAAVLLNDTLQSTVYTIALALQYLADLYREVFGEPEPAASPSAALLALPSFASDAEVEDASDGA
jgi:hypothetical protein